MAAEGVRRRVSCGVESDRGGFGGGGSDGVCGGPSARGPPFGCQGFKQNPFCVRWVQTNPLVISRIEIKPFLLGAVVEPNPFGPEGDLDQTQTLSKFDVKGKT